MAALLRPAEGHALAAFLCVSGEPPGGHFSFGPGAFTRSAPGSEYGEKTRVVAAGRVFLLGNACLAFFGKSAVSGVWPLRRYDRTDSSFTTS